MCIFEGSLLCIIGLCSTILSLPSIFLFSATVRAPRCTQSTTTSPPHPTPHCHRNHAHCSNITSSEMTSSPLLKSTGQTIAQQFSDSGSSDEGEDTLTKQGYINAGRHHISTGGKDDRTLVHSTLSAIQNGKIRTDSTHRGTYMRQWGILEL